MHEYLWVGVVDRREQNPTAAKEGVGNQAEGLLEWGLQIFWAAVAAHSPCAQLVCSPNKKKQKVESESEEEQTQDKGDGGDEMYLVGGGDELGAYDDSQFQENEGEKKKKTINKKVKTKFNLFRTINNIEEGIE